MERRQSPRFRSRFDALVSTGPREGVGVLTDISYGGARLEDSTVLPPVGSRVRLYVFVQPVFPFEIEGLVSRHIENGFAIRCEILDPQIRRLVDDVAALFSVPAPG